MIITIVKQLKPFCASLGSTQALNGLQMWYNNRNQQRFSPKTFGRLTRLAKTHCFGIAFILSSSGSAKAELRRVNPPANSRKEFADVV